MASSDANEAREVHSPRRHRFRRRILIVSIVAVFGAVMWFLQTPKSLTTAESQLVGIWTLGMPPNPPSNAVEQIYELRSDRTIKTYHRPVATGVKVLSGQGVWRLEGEMLVWNVDKADLHTRLRMLLAGRTSSYDSHLRVLGVDRDEFFVESVSGSKTPFRRFTDGR